MSALAESTAFIFGIVAIGYLVAWMGLLGPAVGPALTAFATTIALPALLFRTLVSADFSAAAPLLVWTAYFVPIAVCWAIGQFAAIRLFGRASRGGIIAGMCASFSNLVLLAIPFISSVYGEPGVSVLSLVIAVHLPVMLGMTALLFAIVGGREDGASPGHAVKGFLMALATNAMVIGILAGSVWRVTGLPLPPLGMRIVDTFATVAGPLALFAMGMSLRGFGVTANFGAALFMTGLKLVVMPAGVLLLALLLGLPPLAAKVAVVSAAMPTGVNPYLIAMRFGAGQALASNSLTIGTVLAVITTTLWLTIAEQVFG